MRLRVLVILLLLLFTTSAVASGERGRLDASPSDLPQSAQVQHAATRLPQLWAPPGRDRGTTWSTVSARPRQ
jgi:hypothetical protein